MDSLQTFFYLSPVTILALTAIFVLLLDLFYTDERKKLVSLLTVAGVAFSAFTAFQLWSEGSQFLFNEAVRMDRYSLFFTFLALGITLLTLLNAYPLLKSKQVPAGEFLFMLLSTCIGMMLMAWSTDLITLFMSLEIMSLAAYILTGIRKDQYKATEGAFKYFLLGAFSTGFLLYGIAFVYAAVGSTHYSEISTFLVQSQYTIPTIFYIGVALILIGFGFKVALVPFHMWVPDVYEAAHPSITALMATGVKAAAFSAFVRFFFVSVFATKPEWNTIVFWIAIATMTVGNLAALMQKNIIRMLAYSSIAHAGYILIAVVAAQTQIFVLSASSILFYLIAYGFMTIGAFTVVLYASQTSDHYQIDDYAGYGFTHPYLGLAMTLFMLSLTGIPLTAGFIGKFYVFSAALKSGLIALVLIALLNSLIGAYYYLRVVVYFYMKKEESSVLPHSAPIFAVLAITIAGTLLLGIFPDWCLNIIKTSITALF